MNGEVGRPKLPFQASSPRRAGQAYERDTLAAATQAAIKTDDPIVRPPVLEKPSSMLGQGTLTCGTGRGLGTGLEIDGDWSTSSEFRMMQSLERLS